MNLDATPARIDTETTDPQPAPPASSRSLRLREDALRGLLPLVAAIVCLLALAHGLARAGGR